MTQPFLKAYSELLVRTCHRRGAHAMGGMAAQIPIAGDAAANDAAMARVRADKLREAEAGHDGTWVAHPPLIPIAREVFDAHMPGAHQYDVAREGPGASPGQAVQVTTAALLAPSRGPIPRARLPGHGEVRWPYSPPGPGGNGCGE